MRAAVLITAMALTLCVLDVGANETQPAHAPDRMVISFGDLNMGLEQDAKVLLQRIERAAAKVCGGHPTFSSVTGALDNTFDACREMAIRSAVERLNAPLVTALYSAVCQGRSRHCA